MHCACVRIAPPATEGSLNTYSFHHGQVPVGLLHTTGNVVAVRVSTIGGKGTRADGAYPGGLYDDPALQDADVSHSRMLHISAVITHE